MLQRLTSRILVAMILVLIAVPIALTDPTSPITVTNVDSPDPVASGDQLQYTITIQNTGGARLTNMLLADQLNGVGGIGVPPQLVITSSRGSCTQSALLVNCNGGQIEGNGVWVVTIRGIVTAPGGTTINNTATVSGTKSAQNFTTTTTTTTLVTGGGGAPMPDLTIAKTGPTAVQVSSAMTYTLTVNNIGTANATNVKVVDTVPSGLTGVTASGTSLFVCGVAGLTVTCDGGAVNFGSNATITINATSPASPGTITNTAAVDPDNTIAESNELNNTSSLVDTQVSAAPPPPALGINLTDDPLQLAGAGPDPVTPGGTLTYKILVTNNSLYRADDVNIVDGTQGLNASTLTATQIVTNGQIGNTGGCFITAPQARCSVRTLQPGGTILMTITGSVVASAGSTLIDTATVTGNIRNTGYTSNDSELTTVKPGIDLTITNADSPDPVCARSWPGTVPPSDPGGVCLGGLTYTFVVGNSGIYDAVGVVVRDPLPPGTVYDAAHSSAPAFTGCSVDASNVLTCVGGSIPHESTTTITINVVAPPTTGTISNTVTVDPNNAIFEADETNNMATQVTQVVTGVDLVIAKFDSPPGSPAGFDPIATSGTQTYTIVVDNIGTQDTTNIRVRDQLPAGTIFRNAFGDHGFTCSPAPNNTVECVGGSLLGTASEFYPPFGAPGSDKATIVIKCFAQPIIGVMHDEVRVDPLNEIAEANEGNNIAFQDTTVTTGGAGMGAFNQFTINKTQVSPANPVARNAKVTYKIDLFNDGTDPATGVTVRDFLPAGARYIEATGDHHFNCNQVLNYINCTGGELAAGGGATIMLTAFAPDTPGTYTNQAIVDPDNAIPEGNEFDNQSSVQTVVINHGNGMFYDLTVVKTQTSPANAVARNAVVTYDLAVTNIGTDPVIGVKVTDTLPAGSRFIQAADAGTNQFLCTNTNNVVSCLGGQIAGSGGTAHITVKMFAPDTPGDYVNQAIVDPDNTIPEGDEENNRSQVTTTVTDGGNGPFNDLTITKSCGTGNTYPGGPIQYTLDVTNNGSDAALNVAVRDVLPAGETYVSAADGGGLGAFTCQNQGSVVNCTGATINGGGATRTIIINATAPNQVITTPPLHNEAVVDPDNTIPEGSELNNTSSCDYTVTSKLNLTVTKSGPITASQSDVTDYTITVTNNAVSGGGQIATGVVMVDPLPVGLIPLAVDAGSGNNWACSVGENPINVVTCTGDLDKDGSGASVTIKITVFITAEDGRSLDNTACVDPGNTIIESNELDNCSEFGTFVAPPAPSAPDLLVSKQASSLSTSPGADLTYTLSISNVGNADAQGWDGSTGLTLQDTLSSELTFTNFTPTNGWDCTFVSPTLTCHDNGSGMSPGTNAQITILAHVNDSATLPISNTAHASPALFVPLTCSGTAGCVNETNLGNNDSTVVTSVGGSGFDLAIASITDVPDPVIAGQALKYTIVAVNGGTATANSVHIKVDLPSSGAVFQNADGSNGFNCGAPSGGSIDCVGNLPGSGSTVITVNFIIPLFGLPPDLTLTATIDPTDAFSETDEGNNSKTEMTTISASGACTGCVDLVASQLIATPEPGHTATPEIVKFQIVNIGDSPTTLNPASDALLRIHLAQNPPIGAITATSGNDTDYPCTVAFGANFADVTCRGNLAPAQGITITVTVPGLKTPALFVTATADPDHLVDEGSNEGNNTLVQTVVVLTP